MECWMPSISSRASAPSIHYRLGSLLSPESKKTKNSGSLATTQRSNNEEAPKESLKKLNHSPSNYFHKNNQSGDNPKFVAKKISSKLFCTITVGRDCRMSCFVCNNSNGQDAHKCFRAHDESSSSRVERERIKKKRERERENVRSWRLPESNWWEPLRSHPYFFLSLQRGSPRGHFYSPPLDSPTPPPKNIDEVKTSWLFVFLSLLLSFSITKKTKKNFFLDSGRTSFVFVSISIG